MPYPQPIKDAVANLCEELKKHYPEVFERKYDDHGYCSEDKNSSAFHQRIEMGLYIELVKAGAFNEKKQC